MNASEREIFFYDHAGYSYDANADEATRLIARLDNARNLAWAEDEMVGRGWSVVTAYDWDDCADPDDDGETAEKLASGEWERLFVSVVDENGRDMANLGSVIVTGPDDAYVRVVAAELAAELLASHAECHARTTCGNCGHAWCERCDPAPSALCHWCHGRGWSEAEMEPAHEYMGMAR